MCHLVGALGAHNGNVGAFLEALAMIEQQPCHKQCRQYEPQPVGKAVDEIVVTFLQVQVAKLYMQDVAVLLFNATGTMRCRSTAALAHRQVVVGGRQRYIFALRGVEIGEHSLWYAVFTHKLRNEGVVERNATRHGGAVWFGIDVGLRVIYLKLRREAYSGRLHIFDIAATPYHHIVGGCFVGF